MSNDAAAPGSGGQRDRQGRAAQASGRRCGRLRSPSTRMPAVSCATTRVTRVMRKIVIGIGNAPMWRPSLTSSDTWFAALHNASAALHNAGVVRLRAAVAR